MEREIKVLVVDDSAFMRKIISDILNSDDDIQVIDTAKNGKEALEKVQKLNPDVITMDIEMPLMDGLSCLKELMKTKRIPVIMLSSLTTQGARATIQALEDGAIDFITKPSNIFDMKGNEQKQELIDKVKMAKSVSITKRFYITNVQKKPKNDIIRSNNMKNVVAIGTSTGGPKALQEVIPSVPGSIPAAFLIVQHMPPGFTRSLAERLNSMSELEVKEAEDGELVKPGYAYIAPGDYHMLVEGVNADSLRIKLSRGAPVGGHRPAVNVMMDSLSDTGIRNIVAVIMTGMGGDGSEGIKKIKTKNNGHIIAQDEQSCVVYGMPRMAVQTGMVDAIVPLKNISNEIIKIVGGQK